MNKNQMNRRDWLRNLSLASAAFLAGCRSVCCCGNKMRLACQMWSVNDLWKKDFPGTLAKMRAMGYEGVQSMAFWNMKRTELHKVLDDNGLVIVDMPVNLDCVKDDKINSTVEFCKEFNVDFLFLPWIGNRALPKEKWQWYEDGMVEAAHKLAPYGIKMGFHNHQIEFKVKFDGVSVMESFFKRKELFFELDAGHVKLAGEDPVKILERIKGRVPSIHAKPGGGNSAGCAEDKNDWAAIISSCNRMGTKWAVVECETRRNTFDDIDASARFLKPVL